VDQLSHALVERPNRADHQDAVGDDVAANTALDAADRDDGGTRRQIHLAADNGLEREDDLGCDDDRVDATPRNRAVRLTSADDDAQSVRACHQPGRANRHLADTVSGERVESEDRRRPRVAEHAVPDHRRGAAQSCPRGLLSRLEDELDHARQLRAHRGEDLGRAHQHRDVGVVPAGVHDADILTIDPGPYARPEGEVVLFRDR
jgi:hypothetical protein